MAFFSIVHRDAISRARVGSVQLPHGQVTTPAFMPVGTHGTVKAVLKDALETIGFEIILANTYHLFLRPGPDVIQEAGGLHGFSRWQRNFLTDSGGFQVFSLAALRKLTDDGVTFHSHRDGSRHFFSPEMVVDVQVQFNSDIQMQLDVCLGWGAARDETERALDLTTRWANRACERWQAARAAGYAGSLFPIVQGGFFEDLRQRSAQAVAALDTPGIAIGGLSVGEPADAYAHFLQHTVQFLPEDKPKYVMGIGTPEYILEAIADGIDLFDCVLPTRNARNGSYFTHDGMLSIKQERFTRDFTPVDDGCTCPVCRTYSRAYLRHLFKEQEIASSVLASYHNLYFLHQLVLDARVAIASGSFIQFKDNFLARFHTGNIR